MQSHSPLLSQMKDRPVVLAWSAICLCFAWLAWQPFHNQGLDFSLYYSIGELFPAGQGMDIFISGEQGPWYGYSPMVAPFFSILQWLPLKHSFDLFFALKIFSLGLWPYLLAHCSNKVSSFSSKYVLAAAATLVILPAIYEETIVGNINTYLLTLMFAAFAFTRYGYYTTGAAMITLIAAFKPQYALFFIPPLMVSPKRSILGGVISTTFLVAMSCFIYGPNGFQVLLHRWLELISAPLALPSDANNMSTTGVVVRMLSPLGLSMSGTLQDVNVLSLSENVAMTITRVITSIFVVAILISIFRRRRTGHKDRLLDLYAGITLITLFATPVIWLTHYMFLVVPVFAMVSMQFQSHKLWTIVCTGFAAICYFLAGQMPGNTETTTILARTYGLPFYALIAITLLFVLSKPGENHAA